MIQVFRQFETNEVLFSIQFQKIRKENMDIFLIESMLDKKRSEGEAE